MARFKYLAYSKDQKQLSGFLQADSMEEAREELHKLGLSVISINETEETQDAPLQGKQTFSFEAADKTGKRLQGTIDAENIFKAYSRLVGEYKFKLYWIVPEGLSDIEKEQQKSQNLLELQQQYEKYLAEEERRHTPLMKRIFGTTNLKDIQKNIEVIQRQTEAVIAKAKEALELMGNNISPDARTAIKHKIDELLIFKTSTNTERLQVLSNDLLRLIKEQQTLLKKEGIIDEDETGSRLNTLFQEMYSFSRFRDIKVDFGSIGKVIAQFQSALATLKVNRQEEKSEELLERESVLHELRTKIKNGYTELRAQFQVFLKLFASGKSKLLQQETWGNITQLRKQIQQHRAQIKFLQKEVITIKKERQQRRLERFDVVGVHFLNSANLLYEVKIFIQWLLLFYMGYFLSCIIILQYSITPLEGLARTSLITSPILSYIIVLLALLYGGISLQQSILRRHHLLTLLMILIGVTLYLLFLANF